MPDEPSHTYSMGLGSDATAAQKEVEQRFWAKAAPILAALQKDNGEFLTHLAAELEAEFQPQAEAAGCSLVLNFSIDVETKATLRPNAPATAGEQV